MNIQPSVSSSYSCITMKEKVPLDVTSKDLINQALQILPQQQGTREQILESAISLCPAASKEVNPGFHKTLEQALSKHLEVVSPSLVHLIAPQSVINEAIAKESFQNFKDLCVSCLASLPNKQVEFDTFKKLLFDRYKHKLLKDCHKEP